VRVDPQDNIWVVDEGSNMIVKFNPEARVVMTMGRKPEAVPVPEPHGRAGSEPESPVTFSIGRPTWPGTPPEIFSSPMAMATRGSPSSTRTGSSSKPGFERDRAGSVQHAHSIATDAQGNVYVGDRGNKRLQVFDNDGTFKTES